jgi:tetratricopeptide (TPR) repeat protein
VALLRSLQRPADAITALIKLLDAVPTDAEAWCELSDLYQSQGLSSQAIFSLEEALLIAPNAWNVWLLFSPQLG